MIEIPESKNLEVQATQSLMGKKIKKVFTSNNPHKFCWFNGDLKNYAKLLEGKTIIGAKGHGMYLDLCMESDTSLSIGEGAIIKFCEPFENRPEKYQIMIDFDDNTYLVFTVAMYGSILAYMGMLDDKYHIGSLKSISPLSENFNEKYFESLFTEAGKDMSVKAFLTTEQRIPGLGNGSLQDILICSGIHPKRKISALSDSEKDGLLYNVKAILKDMVTRGGRDTEKDLFGKFGGYKTILSKNSCKEPCRLCGGAIVKEPYLGGAIYYCKTCQRL